MSTKKRATKVQGELDLFARALADLKADRLEDIVSAAHQARNRNLEDHQWDAVAGVIHEGNA